MFIKPISHKITTLLRKEVKKGQRQGGKRELFNKFYCLHNKVQTPYHISLVHLAVPAGTFLASSPATLSPKCLCFLHTSLPQT
jgi:hypothetical protein